MTQIARDFREMLTEQWQYRELSYQMTKRDLLLRYKQTAMGFAWAFMMPLVNTAVFWTVFTKVAPVQTQVPYALFAYCGLVTWNFSASSWRFSVMSLTSNVTLVTKVYFPREVFPIAATLVSLADFAIGFIPLIALMIYFQVQLTPAVLFLPVVVLVHVAFTVGVSFALAIANLFYRDVKYLFEVLITIWMFATAVVYPLDFVGGRLGTLLLLNPMTGIVEGYRSVLLYGTLPAPVPFAVASVVAVATLGGCWLLFHRAEFTFAETI